MYLIFCSTSGISKIFFNSTINSLRTNTSLAAADKAIYSASIIDKAISIYSLLNHEIGQPVLDLTELGYSHVVYVVTYKVCINITSLMHISYLRERLILLVWGLQGSH